MRRHRFWPKWKTRVTALVKLRDWLTAARDGLAQSGVPDPMPEARRLAEFALGLGAGRLTLHLGDSLTAEQQVALQGALSARQARVPFSHIRGLREFWGREFIVTPDVLDPRPETETLVATALERPFDTLLDLGTGSGAIAISLLADRPTTRGVAVDVSAAALSVAGRNAAALGVADRLELVQSNWCAAVTGRFDLIVSNPPYIAQAEMADLSPEVRDHEPHLALTDGKDGLECYRIIAQQAPAYLADGGRLMVEIGPTQARPVCTFFDQAGLIDVAVVRDFDGRDRVVTARAAPR